MWDKIGVPPVLEEYAQRTWASGESTKSSPIQLLRDGKAVWCVVTHFPIRTADGQMEAIGALTSDITELAEARNAFELREATLRNHGQTLTDIVRATVVISRSLTDATHILLEIVADMLQVEFASVLEMDYQAGLARCIDDFQRSTRRHAFVPDAEIGEYRELVTDLERDGVLTIEDVQADPRLAARRPVMAARRIGSGLIVAAYAGERIQAIVTFGHVGVTRSWTAEDVAFARSIGNVVSLILLTSRYREALAALDLVGAAIYVERADGRVIYANQPALELAWPTDATDHPRLGAGQSSPSFPPSAFPRPNQPLCTDRDRSELAWTSRDGVRDLEINRARLPGGGVVSVAADVTRQRAESRERERLQQQLQQSSRIEAIGQLAGGIAHDFNNILGAIIGFARFLEQDLPPGSDQRRFASRILSASERGKTLVSQILTFARARSLERRALDLRAVVEETCQLVTGSLPAGVRLAVDPGERSFPVLGNAGQLGQVVFNLCVNARDALAERGRPGRRG